MSKGTASYLWYWPSGGWDFDDWRERCDLSLTHAAADMEPIPLLPSGASLAAWEQGRVQIWERLGFLLGDLTDQPPTKGPQAQFLGEPLHKTGQNPYTLGRLRYRLTDDEWGYAWLLTPTIEGANDALRPAVIALHPTAAQGKAVTAGLEADTPPGEPSQWGRDYGHELAERGFVVLVPDAIGFGERQANHANARYHSAHQFFEAHPDGSVMGKMCFDTSRAVDLLQSLPGVDGERIGCIGHSHGGYGTLFALVTDERIGAGVVSCGLSPLQTDSGVERWWRRTALLPRLGLFENQMHRAPLQFSHLMALAAPRPLFIAAALDDDCFPGLETLSAEIAAARRIYEGYGAGDRLQELLFAGEHRFPPFARTQAYSFLHDALNARDALSVKGSRHAR